MKLMVGLIITFSLVVFTPSVGSANDEWIPLFEGWSWNCYVRVYSRTVLVTHEGGVPYQESDLEVISEAIKQLSEASGVNFKLVPRYTTFQPHVEIYFVDPEGFGPGNQAATFVTGDYPYYRGGMIQFRNDIPVRLWVALHEFGHIGGLGHAGYGVMTNLQRLEYSDGDKQGLATLGCKTRGKV